MTDKPTVAVAVEVTLANEARVGCTGERVVLRIHHSEFDMTPAAARELAKALVKFADVVEPGGGAH